MSPSRSARSRVPAGRSGETPSSRSNATCRGAAGNVIRPIWGSGWDPLIARDSTGLLLKRMEEADDGEYQDFKSKDGAYVREKFFGKYPELAEMVAGMTDDEIWALNRGGHDPVTG